MQKQVRVYLLMDPRVTASGTPGWVGANFVDSHEETAQSGTANNQRGAEANRGPGTNGDTDMGYFEIYSGEFDAGQVCLGGNGCNLAMMQADAMTGTCSNYIAFIGPQDIEP